MARTDTLGHFLTDVADAIRTKTGSTASITASNFDTEIENIPSGGDYNVKVDISKTYTSNGGLQSLLTNVSIDTTGLRNFNSMFKYCMNLTTTPELNTSSATDMGSMFFACSSLITASLLDTSNNGYFDYMFQACSNLTTVPVFDTQKVVSFYNMFAGCSSLTDTSLDNILQMCINATIYTGTKTLVQLGFSSSNYSASRIQALPHYQDFIDAGWTIGY